MRERRILLIEDERPSREILEIVLTGASYTVDVADTASAAHTFLNSQRYALGVANWLLPDGDGIYLGIVRRGRVPRTLIVTGHFSDLPAGTASLHHVLMKPSKPESLIALVRVRVNRRQILVWHGANIKPIGSPRHDLLSSIPGRSALYAPRRGSQTKKKPPKLILNESLGCIRK